MIFKPGGQPPFVIPFCGYCELPVECFTFMPIKSPYYVEIEAQCCDKTQGIRLSREEVMRVKQTNSKLMLVTRAKRHQGVYEIRRAV